MDRHLQHQVEKLSLELPAAQEALRVLCERRALARIGTGQGRWRDFEAAAKPHLAASRTNVLGWVPASVVNRAEGPAATLDAPLLVLADLAAHVPGETLSTTCRELAQRCLTGWQSDDVLEAMMWTAIRLLIGPDGGDRLRQACWRRCGTGWILSDEVVAAVPVVNRWAPTGGLQLLSRQERDHEGRLLRITVGEGGTLRWEEAPG